MTKTRSEDTGPKRLQSRPENAPTATATDFGQRPETAKASNPEGELACCVVDLLVAQICASSNQDVSVHLRPSGYGGQPSRGLPTVAHALVGKRERRLVGAGGIEPPTPRV